LSPHLLIPVESPRDIAYSFPSYAAEAFFSFFSSSENRGGESRFLSFFFWERQWTVIPFPPATSIPRCFLSVMLGGAFSLLFPRAPSPSHIEVLFPLVIPSPEQDDVPFLLIRFFLFFSSCGNECSHPVHLRISFFFPPVEQQYALAVASR